MADQQLPATRNVSVVKKSNEDNVSFVVDKFKVGDTVDHLYTMMKKATEKDYSPSAINAACNCVCRMNETINTVINAAKFLSQEK